MRSEVLENLLGVDQPTCGDVSVRFAQGFVECCSYRFIQPVAGVERQQIYFGSIWQIGRLVNDKSTFSDMCLDDHGIECNTRRAAQQNVAAAKPLATATQIRNNLPAWLAAER